MDVPFVDLKREYELVKREMIKELTKVLEEGQFILGKNVELFEEEFANYCDAKYAVGVGTGTDALVLALKAWGIKEGDEVITAANTFIATVDSISRIGAKPILVDIDPDTYLINVEKIEENITPKTKAIIPVHLYGQTVDMDPIIEIREKYGLIVIEDACQAQGSKYKNKKTGSLGDCACFSFYPTKPLGGYGDSGIVVTNNQEIAEKIKMLRNYGQSKKYFHDFIGYNSRLDEIQACVLRVKLKYLDKNNEKRRNCAKLYNELLINTPIITPTESLFSKHVFHLYVIRCEERDKLQQFLNSKSIYTGIHYPIPIHFQKAYSYLRYKRGDFPVTETYSNEILSLPMFPQIEEEEIMYVCDSIKEFYREKEVQTNIQTLA